MTKSEKVLLKGLSKFTDERNIKKVRLIFNEFHPSDIYNEVKNWPDEKAVLLLRLLEENGASELFSEMSPKQQSIVIELLSSEEIAEIFEELYADEAVDILDDLPAKITRKVLASTDTKTRIKINKILRYEKYQNGYHMVVDYVAIPDGITIGKAIKLIQHQINDDDLEIIGNIFVYSKKNGEFIGYISAGDIIAQDDKSKIDKFIEKIDPVSTTDHISVAQDSIAQYDIPSMPVVDSKNKLVGAIEAEDIIEWYEEAEETVLEQAAVKIIDKPYGDITVFELFKARIPWIAILLIVGALSQIIIMGFQMWWASEGWIEFSDGGASSSIFSSIPALAITTAISIVGSISGTSGNVASQSSSTLVRAIALGEVGKGNYWKVIRKELSVSTIVGFTVMITGFIRIMLIWGIMGGFSEGGEVILNMLEVATVASLSLFLTVLIGNLLGAALPMIANKFGIDGAVFSGPVQTTIIDIISIAIYFLLTTVLMIVIV